MWPQNYTPVAGSLGISALVAALPIFVLLYLLGVKRKPALVAAVPALVTAAGVALVAYGMPALNMLSAALYGAAFGLVPIGWVIFTTILLYRITTDTGKFEILKDSIGSLTTDRRLQALLIAFAFGGFIEGSAGFGAPIAVAGAMLAGVGFAPMYAAGICLLANTSPVAYGSIGTPVLTLATVTNLPLLKLSASVGAICSPVALFVPAYLMMVMGGWKALRGVLPAVIIGGVAFASTQFVISTYVGPQLAGVLGALVTLTALLLLLRFWRPKDHFRFEGELPAAAPSRRHSGRELFLAWAPYGLLVICVLFSGWTPMSKALNSTNIMIHWPLLDNQVQRMPPVVSAPSPYPAVYSLPWLSASGTAALVASLLAALLLGMSPRQFAGTVAKTAKQLLIPELTIATVLALAFLMNYSGATATLGLGFAATGSLFPFFSPLLGWLGVFLTGSDTSANALFGNLQVVTAQRLHFSPILMAAANSAGGVTGKMIGLQSIAVGAAATGLKPADEAALFRFTLKHSIFLSLVIALIVCFYAYAGLAG